MKNIIKRIALLTLVSGIVVSPVMPAQTKEQSLFQKARIVWLAVITSYIIYDLWKGNFGRAGGLCGTLLGTELLPRYMRYHYQKNSIPLTATEISIGFLGVMMLEELGVFAGLKIASLARK
jgi:hypothetical protein